MGLQVSLLLYLERSLYLPIVSIDDHVKISKMISKHKS